MEISAHLYEWLQGKNIFDLQPLSKNSLSVLPVSLQSAMEDGPGLLPLLEILGSHHSELQPPSLSQPTSTSEKMNNWNLISEFVGQLGGYIDSDSKSLIVAGEPTGLQHVLDILYKLEPKSTSKPKQNKDGGVFLEHIHPSNSLDSTENCLEFLLLSFCRNFNLNPKQAAGLLTQGNKYLAHIVVKGLKGDFNPVISWYQEVYGSVEHLASLVKAENKNDSLRFVLESLKPGLISNNGETAQWAMSVLSRFVLEQDTLLEDLWQWFIGTEVLSMCIFSLQKHGQLEVLVELLMQISQNHYLELFSQYLKNSFVENQHYFKAMTEWLPLIADSESVRSELIESGVIDMWIELCSNEGDSISSKASALAFCVGIVNTLHNSLGESELNMTLSLCHRLCRSASHTLSCMGISAVFYMLEFLADLKSAFAPVIYKTAVFILVENYTSIEKRELILQNLLSVIVKNPTIPVGILVEPLVKCIQAQDFVVQCSDIQFFTVLAQHPRLGLKHAIQFIDAVGNMYINNLLYSRANGAPFTHIAARFVEMEPMQEYLYMFCKYGLSLVIQTELKTAPKIESKYSRSLLLEMISWIIQQWQDDLNEKLRILLVETCVSYEENISKEFKTGITLLNLMGDAHEMLGAFNREDNESRQLALQSELLPVIAHKSSNKPLNRITADIEKAKKSFADKKTRAQQQEEQKVMKWEKKYNKIKQDLDARKVVQGRSKDKAVAVYEEGAVKAQVEDFGLYEFDETEEAVPIILKKYSRVFKVLFTKYSGTGFERKPEGISDFEWLRDRKSKINEAEFVKILNEYLVIPKLLSKEELKQILRSYCYKVLKQPDQGYVDFEGFKGMMAQIALRIYTKPSQDFSHFPPVISIYQLLLYLRSSAVIRGESTEIYDEPDPGTADRLTAKSLTEKIQENPEEPLPEGMVKVPDYDIQMTYELPSQLGLSEAYKDSYEILDSLLFSAVGVHVIEPQVTMKKTFRVKGIPPKKVVPERPPIYERELKRPKPPSPPPPTIPKKKLNPGVITQVMSRPPVRISEKAEAVKERERQEEERKAKADEMKRINRQKKLQEELAKAKEERSAKLQEQEARVQELRAKEKARENVKAEKEKKEKEEKAKMLKEWNEKRAAEIERKNQVDPEKVKEQKEMQKKNKEKVELMLQEKQAKAKAQKEMEEKQKAKAEIKAKSKKNLLGSKSVSNEPKSNRNQKSSEDRKVSEPNEA